MPADPIFIETDAEAIISECTAYYENLVGRTLLPAQAETLLINAFAYRELLIRQQIQLACKQMLLSFATAPALDYLAELVGVARLSAVGATCTLQFSLTPGHGTVTIPAGTRVSTSDGKIIFSTIEDVSANTGTDEIEVEAFAENLGVAGNGYAPGFVNTIIDPLAFVSTVENTDTTAGGSDEETDDDLRSRTRLAPSAFSVAGPKNAYKYSALTASPAIIDVAVEQIEPGTVGVWPLVEGGATPDAIIDLVVAALNDDSVRPLTDTVVVEAPTVVNYNLSVNIDIFPGQDAEDIQAQALVILAAFAAEKGGKMGQDIILNQIIARVGSIPGVYNIEMDAPASDIVIDTNEVAIVGTIAAEVVNEFE